MDDSDQAARLRGRRILITGASSGVGLAAACLFAREGAEPVLVSRRADLAAEQLEQRGLHAIPACADLADREAAEEAVPTAVEELGGLDVVVSNAARPSSATCSRSIPATSTGRSPSRFTEPSTSSAPRFRTCASRRA